MKLFRSGPSPHQTALAMIGAKPGSTVIVIGMGDPALAAEVALVTGLNGRTLVIVPSADAQPRVETAAASAGALVDVETSDPTSLPAADSAFDIAVVTDLAPATPNGDQIVREAARVVRSGGRVVMIEGRKSAAFENSSQPLSLRRTPQPMNSCGFSREPAFVGRDCSEAPKVSATTRGRNKRRFLRSHRSLRRRYSSGDVGSKERPDVCPLFLGLKGR